MSQDRWSSVDQYIADSLIGPDSALEAALQASTNAGLPSINVAPNQGKLLHLLARTVNAQRILEIGTLGGYSTIWLGRALPSEGRLITLELDPKHAEVARSNIALAGLSRQVEVRIGKALDLLPKIAAENAGPFDLTFIDADKASIPEYFQWALQLSRPGSLIIVDNVIRNGAVIEADSKDPSVRGVRRLNEMLAKEPRVSATSIQTVGVKGYDGFTLALVVS
jgi:predicted O-methyltransferase YrrM